MSRRLASVASSLTQSEPIDVLDQTGGGGVNFFQLNGTDLTDKFVAGITFAVNGSTGNDGTYTVTSSSLDTGNTKIVVDEAIPSAVVDGSINYSANIVRVEAKYPGKGYNGNIVVSAAASGDATKVDLTVSFEQSPDATDEVVQNIQLTPTGQDITDANEVFVNYNITLVVGDIPTGTIAVGGGNEVVSNIDANDYTGNKGAGNGLYSFSSNKTGTRLINMVADPVIDAAYAAYSEARKDIRFHLGTPIGANAQGMSDYRFGEGTYSHTPVNTHFGRMIVGDLSVPDPRNVTTQLILPGVVAAFPNILLKDANGFPWLHAAILPDFGVLGKPNNGVPFDINSNDNRPDFDIISATKGGINAVTNDETYGAVYFNNDTTLLDKTSRLSREETSDLIIYMFREIPNLLKQSQFRPNDPITWQRTYLRARPFMESLEDGRAIERGEDVKWFWIGDQNAETIADAEFNQQADIENGEFKIRVVFIPISATRFIQLDIVATSDSILQFVVNEDVNS